MKDMEPAKQTFPFKLYHTLEWASTSEFSSALSWSASGHAFVVHDREAIVENIIPHFFDHKKWRSFTRQLNLWGFKRELRGPNSLGETYYHKHFKRGNMEELQLMQRTEIKRRFAKKKLSSSSPPSSTVTSNHTQSQTGDITQGASFLTGLKGGPEVARPNVVTRGGLPAVAYHHNNMNIHGPGQMGSMIPYNTSSLPPTIVQEAAAVHPQIFQSLMMVQPQMRQGYPTGNWNPQNNFSRGMLHNMPTEQLIAMASSINRFSMNGLNMLQPADGTRTVSGSSLNSSLSSTTTPQLGTRGNTTYENRTARNLNS
ncbi:hypothetical protein ACHAWT_001993 [Skeletonema menzelii]